jgi:formylglycine-generating enzyme required for sulfatase activity
MRPFAIALMLCAAAAGQDTRYRPVNQQLPGPSSPAEASEWLADIRHWRDEYRIRIGYSGAEYDRPQLRWTQRSFVQPLSMVEDRYLYDPVRRVYTVDRFLDDFDKRYGGIDSVLLWPVYPNIGVDSRNQWDLLRDMPGGVEGLRGMIDGFHRRGVRVFFPTMGWDNGTRPAGMTHWEATVEVLKVIGADGINGDTYRGVPRAFREASDRSGHIMAIEPEVAMASGEQIMWNVLSWGYWTYTFVPGVSEYKWVEPRHMVHVCRRWARDKTDDLQSAFFNGAGFESWENVWGIWNGLTARDSETLRRIARIERRFAEFLVSPDWEPHTPVIQHGVFASKWPQGERTLWTVVNRNQYAVAGEQIRMPHRQGGRYFDLWNGTEVKPDLRDREALVSFSMERSGYGCVLATGPGGLDAGEQAFLKESASLAARALASFDGEWKPLAQQIVPIEPARLPAGRAAGMVKVPAGDFDFAVSGVMIEGGNDEGAGVQYPWEPTPRRHHRRRMRIESFYIDRFPVTNADFKKFLDASGYRPADDHNFLRHWKGGTYPDGAGNKPVVWVSLEDARAFAKWAGKRLPHEWEWQYAAQGTDGRLYPWGNAWEQKRVPAPDRGRDMRLPDDVDAHPEGASPFGVMDMASNVWQWTEEFTDEHTRAAILRGGSFYEPQGSHWYFPQARRLDQHGKYLLVAPSKDRSGGIGFRCAAEAN